MMRLYIAIRKLISGLLPLVLCVSLLSPTVTFADNKVLLIHDGSNEITNDITQSLSSLLATRAITLVQLDIGTQPFPDAEHTRDYLSLITLGKQAADITLEHNPPAPVLSLLLTRQIWSQLKPANSEYARSALLLDQPFDRQLLLINEIFGTSRIGVLLGPWSHTLRNELSEAARLRKHTLMIKTIQEQDELIPALGNLSDHVDVLLAIPDPEVYNKRSIQGILLLTYRSKTPVIGFSQAYSRAGAAISLYSSANDIARDTADILAANPGSSRIYYPGYFSISFNQQVARTLNIDLPDEAQLIEGIRRKEQASR